MRYLTICVSIALPLALIFVFIQNVTIVICINHDHKIAQLTERKKCSNKFDFIGESQSECRTMHRDTIDTKCMLLRFACGRGKFLFQQIESNVLRSVWSCWDVHSEPNKWTAIMVAEKHENDEQTRQLSRDSWKLEHQITSGWVNDLLTDWLSVNEWMNKL